MNIFINLHNRLYDILPLKKNIYNIISFIVDILLDCLRQGYKKMKNMTDAS